jgi:DnaJ family protein B protein 4
VQPGSRITVPGEGMPISKSPGSKGDLLVSIKVTLPRLNDEQRTKMREACSGAQ